MSTSTPDQLRIRALELLHYQTATGLFVWIKAPKSHPEILGQIAGTIRDGYIRIKIDGKSYAAHKLAWLIVYGEWPALIDHRNRQTSDNRLENLRPATRLQNAQNHQRKPKANGLPSGVRTDARGNFVARIRVHKRAVHLGVFKSPHEAFAAYRQAQQQHFGEFCPQ